MERERGGVGFALGSQSRRRAFVLEGEVRLPLAARGTRNCAGREDGLLSWAGERAACAGAAGGLRAMRPRRHIPRARSHDRVRPRLAGRHATRSDDRIDRPQGAQQLAGRLMPARPSPRSHGAERSRALSRQSSSPLPGGAEFRRLFPTPSLSSPFLLFGRANLRGGSAFPRNPPFSSQISLSRGVRAPR